jgi:hypothetical protein
LELHGERSLRTLPQILQNGGKKVVFEPFFVKAVGCPQVDATLVDAQAFYGAQPLVTVGRVDPSFNRTDSFTPELNHCSIHNKVSRETQTMSAS